MNKNLKSFKILYKVNNELRSLVAWDYSMDNEKALNYVYLSLASNYPDDWDLINKNVINVENGLLTFEFDEIKELYEKINVKSKEEIYAKLNDDSFFDKTDRINKWKSI